MASTPRIGGSAVARRSPLAAIFQGFVSYSGLAWLARRTVMRDRPVVVCLHDPEPDVLRRLLALLAPRYTFVRLDDIEAWHDDAATSLPRRALAVTLDDGWARNAALRDVCAEFGVVPTVFVCTAIVGTARRFWWQATDDQRRRQELKELPDAGRVAALAALGTTETDAVAGPPAALSTTQLTDLAAWADIQSHTRLHPILPRCDEQRAWDEIDGSRRDLAGMLGAAPDVLAYPNGDAGPREADMARRAGYRSAWTVEPRPARRTDDPFAMPRVFLEDEPANTEVIARLSGVHGAVRRLLGRR